VLDASYGVCCVPHFHSRTVVALYIAFVRPTMAREGSNPHLYSPYFIRTLIFLPKQASLGACRPWLPLRLAVVSARCSGC
jgi:hypothetical protein